MMDVESYKERQLNKQILYLPIWSPALKENYKDVLSGEDGAKSVRNEIETVRKTIIANQRDLGTSYYSDTAPSADSYLYGTNN